MRTLPTLVCAGAVLLALACDGSDRSTAPASGRISADRSISSEGGDDEGAGGQAVLDFRSLTPNVLTGTAGAIRGVPAGGLPWLLQRARARLTAGDRLRVEVRGLVLAAGPAAGTNPVPQFRATLSCLVENGAGTGYDTVNVSSDPVPASTAGDATIDQTIAVPARCLAPAIFVTSPGGAWFAISG